MMQAMQSRARRVVKKEGVGGLITRIYHNLVHGSYQDSVYGKWIAGKEAGDFADEEARAAAALKLRPKISIVVPVHDTPPAMLDRCLESVVAQTYEVWELCVHDDASGRQDTLKRLRAWAERDDPRIKVSFSDVNRHISASTNEAIRMAEGDFVGLLDHDDELSPHALMEVAMLVNEHPDADLIYSDEDKIDREGRRSAPFFKPGWSPDLLTSVNYINHFCVIRKEIGDRAGWFREGYEGAQDHDLFLRVSLLTDRIFHIPRVLYHWRAVPGSTAGSLEEKDYCGAAGVRALKDFLDARSEAAAVETGATPTEYVVRYPVKGRPKVSIIIPFRDKAELLRKCVGSVLEKTAYPDFEVILISNNSEEETTQAYLDSIDDERVKVLSHDIPFNYSKINNWGASQAGGDFLLFLNNDTEVITPSWIEDMLGYAQRPETGAVGAKLLFADGTIQHGGVIVGIGGFADHVFAGASEGKGTLFGRDTWSRDYLAVTAACMMVERKKFEAAGGFDEEFVVCGSDVELCLRLFGAGLRNVYLSFVKLYHYEAQTRRQRVDQKDIECSLMHYAPFLQNGDPYYNENLSLAAADGNTFREPADSKVE